MGKLNFNPDDFIFEKLPSPDERKTILEYDAKNRLILLRTKDDNDNYVYNSVLISTRINQNILKNIPDEWSNDNDRIIIFAIYEDGEYVMEKEKLKYDFSTKNTKWVHYTSDFLTLEKAKELYEILKAAITIDTEIKNYNAVKDYLELSKTSYYLTEYHKKNNFFVEELLRGTDFKILPDYPEMFENEKEMWITWRNKLREIDGVKHSDFETDLDFILWTQETKWPIRPDQYYGKYPNFEKEYLSTDDQFISNPEFLDLKSSSESVIEVNKYQDLIQTYEVSGFEISETTSKLVAKYNLIKDMEEFKTIKMKELE